jgi:hypothetical protein
MMRVTLTVIAAVFGEYDCTRHEDDPEHQRRRGIG